MKGNASHPYGVDKLVPASALGRKSYVHLQG